MKHLLPILTLALIGAATTASAENYYYEYYKRPTPFLLSEKVETVNLTAKQYYSEHSEWWDEGWAQNNLPYYQYDTITYTNEAEGVQYQITRNSNWNNTFVSNKDNFYRIAITANSDNPTTLYLTDFVDNIGSPKNVNAIYYAPTEEDLKENKDLAKKPVVEYGYRVLTYNETTGEYVAKANSLTTKLLSVDENGNPVISDYKIVDGEKVVTSSKNASIIDSLYFEKSNLDENSETVDASYYVDRFKYELGTFTENTIIELYMKDSTGGEVYSYSGFNEGNVYGESAVDAMGGFGDGERIVMQTDEMLNGYYFNQDETVNPNPKDYTVFDKNDPTKAAQKAMPLSALNPSVSNRIYFGIIASSLGVYTIDDSHTIGSAQPLPGGLPIALVAGLFGLGFSYIRRRKAILG